MAVPDFLVRPLEVLIVDNDRIFAESLAMYLSDGERITVTDIARDLDGALTAISARHFDLALVDVRLDGQSGFQVVEELHAQHPELPTLLMSGLDKAEIEPRALACGARGVLEKTDLAVRGQDALLDAYSAAAGPGKQLH